MGTRGTLGFVVDGQAKMTYNHFDSYPDGLGVDVLTFLTSPAFVEIAAAEQARQLVPVDENQNPTPAERVKFAHLFENVSSGTDWYSLLRGAQGNAQRILEAGVYADAGSFPGDSLFCEWGYVINFDDRVLEVYQGFQKSPHSDGRFANMESYKNVSGTYYPIRLIKTYSFDELPEENVFISEFNEDDDEDEDY